MRKKLIAGILSAAMVCSLTPGIVMTESASAKETGNAAKDAIVSKCEDFIKKDFEEKNKTKYVEGDAIVVYKKDGNIRSKKAAKEAAMNVRSDIRVLGSYEFSDNVAKKSALRKTSVGNSNGFFVQKVHSDKLSTKQLIAELEKDKAVAYAEPNYTIKAAGITDDTYSDYQWTLQNNKLNNSIENADIQPEKEWDFAKTATKEAVVAVVDTGINYLHEDLKDVMWQNPYKPSQLAGTYGYDFMNLDDDPLDDHGHGSHCSGIIAASANNKAGISGICQSGVKLMALKALDENGAGDTFSFLGAYYYMLKAKSLGTNIIAANNSWSGAGEIRSFDDAIKLAGEEGIISVIAAGNDYADLDTRYKAPAGKYIKNSVIVGASTEWDGKAEFSNYGGQSVDIAAPGTDILSTVAYDCLNPSIYTDQQKAALLSGYYDGENFSGSAMQSITVTDMFGNDVTKQIMKTDSDNFFGKSGKSTMFDFKGAKKGSVYTVSVPYKTGYSDTPIFASFMLSTKGPKGYNEGAPENTANRLSASNYISVMHTQLKYNAAQNQVYRDDPVMLNFTPMSSKGSYWSHVTGQCISDYDAKSGVVGGVIEFQVVINNEGDSCFYLDDMAISKENVDYTSFGKYDFYNGTSMAAPTVTGAVALLYRQGDKPETVLSKVFSCVRKADAWKDKCRTGGVLDLSKVEEYAPIIRKTEENDKLQTVLSGYNFGADKGTIAIDGKTLPAEKILSWNDKQVVVDLSDYRYKTVSIELTNTKNYSVSSKYTLKNTKNTLKKAVTLNVEMDYGAPALFSDGTQMYIFMNGVIKTISEKTGEMKDFYTFDQRIFDEYVNDYDKSRMYVRYTTDAVYGADSIWALANISNTYRELNVLVRYNLKTKKVTTTAVKEGMYDTLENPILAFYKNSVYLLGGSEEDLSDPSMMGLGFKGMKQVLCYDVSSKSWEKKADMPTGIVEGKVAVNGDKLYLCGSSSDVDEKSLLLSFDGTSWKQVTDMRLATKTPLFTASNAVGVCKDKLLFLSDGSEGFGSVYAYNLKTGKFEATGYSSGLTSSSWAANSVTIGNTCYFFTYGVENMEVNNSGMVKYGSLYSMPVEGISKPASVVEKEIKVKKITITTSTKKKTVRYGEKLALKAVVTPNNAAKKDVTWTVDKKAYASISAKGVLTPKKAGVGKSVVVKVAAKDGSKVTAKIKISILDKSKKK